MRKTNKFDKNIGEKIHSLRTQKGITRKSLATILNITPQQLQKYEAGKNRLSVYKLHLITLALNCSIMDFNIGVCDQELEKNKRRYTEILLGSI